MSNRIDQVISKLTNGELGSAQQRGYERTKVHRERNAGRALGLDWFGTTLFGTLSSSILAAAMDEVESGVDETEVLERLADAARQQRSLDGGRRTAEQVSSFADSRRQPPDHLWCWTQLSDGSCLLAKEGEGGKQEIWSHRTLDNFVEGQRRDWQAQSGDFKMTFAVPHGVWLGLMMEM